MHPPQAIAVIVRIIAVVVVVIQVRHAEPDRERREMPEVVTTVNEVAAEMPAGDPGEARATHSNAAHGKATSATERSTAVERSSTTEPSTAMETTATVETTSSAAVPTACGGINWRVGTECHDRGKTDHDFLEHGFTPVQVQPHDKDTAGRDIFPSTKN